MKRILVADDEPDIIDILRFRFKKWGYEMIEAVNGQEALDAVKKLRPDLVLLDFRMPVFSGEEVCQQIKNDPELRNIPVIIMTASQEKIRTQIKNAYGADDTILKPFKPEDLLEKITKYLIEG